MKIRYLISLLSLSVLYFILISTLHADASKPGIMTKRCPSCNTLYPDGTKFCGNDGAKLSEIPTKMICPECRKEGVAGESFCKEHGKKLIPFTETVPAKDADALNQKRELAKKYYKEGTDYCESESYDAAIASYKKAEEIFPDFPALHYNMGWLYSKLGNAEQAIHHLQKYIVLAPDASDITEVQSYIIVLKNAIEKRKQVIGTFKNRDEAMKKALIKQKGKYGSVVVPAGEFIMGTNEAREDSYPEHLVYLDAFEIDRYEITNAQYWEFLDFMKRTNDHSKCFKGEPSGKDHTPRFWENEYYNVPDFPVARIDWYDAYAYAAWAGKRLPTEAEWEKAARGLDGRKFPWGNEWDPARCNLSGDTKPVGSNEGGKSVYGCYDMAGSVLEWCADWYLDTYYAERSPRNPKGPDNGLRRVIRGGSCFSQPFQVRTNTRKSERSDLFNVALGFRCVKEVAAE